jgi:hypothetical protein
VEVGVNSVLVSPKKEESTLDRYIDHIEHVINLIESRGWHCRFLSLSTANGRSHEERARRKITTPHFIPTFTTIPTREISLAD